MIINQNEFCLQITKLQLKLIRRLIEILSKFYLRRKCIEKPLIESTNQMEYSRKFDEFIQSLNEYLSTYVNNWKNKKKKPAFAL